MTPEFQRALEEATRLTRRGDLQRATAAIQSALPGLAAHRGGWPAGTAPDDDVIDVEARIVPPASSPAAPPAPMPRAPMPDAPEGTPAHIEEGRFGSGATVRRYKLHVPARPAGAAPPALVVMLHGCTQDADDFAAGTAMHMAAQGQGVCVLYPEQSRRANPQRCWNWFKHSHQGRGRGEVALLAALVRETVARHGIDPARVYVAGLSAGGAMAANLAQAHPELFAAVGIHSGLPAGTARDLPSALEAMSRGPSAGAALPPLPCPAIVFHGDADTTVHPHNGEQAFAAHAPADTVLERSSGRVPGGHGYTRTVRRDAQGRPVAELWVVHGAGHAWSGGGAGSHTDARGPHASSAMLAFFLQHALRQPASTPA